MQTNMLGIIVASITPFDKNDHIDERVLERLLEKNLAEGADGFFLGGSSGECFMLSHEERVRIFAVASRYREKTMLIAHCGAMSTKEAIGLAQEAKALNYRYIAATPPFYWNFTPKEICNYYYDIYNQVGLPIIVYNFPGNTHRDFDITDNEDYRKLFRSPAIAGVKHTNQVVYQMERFIDLNDKLMVFNGFDETMVAGLALGARGNIGSTFNCMLPHYRRIYDAFLSGDIETARMLQHKANTIMETFCKVGLIAAVKYVLRTQGLEVGYPRAPFEELTEEAKSTVDAVLKDNLVS